MKNFERLITRSGRRSGGREARRSLRAAPLAEDLRPVRAGLSGGQFKQLDDAAVLDLLLSETVVRDKSTVANFLDGLSSG